MSLILRVIRDAIQASGKTRYRISQDTGVAQSQLSRLMSGERGLSLDTVEQLADYLGLVVSIRSKGRKGR